MQQRIRGHAAFLWMDESPERAERVWCGEIVIAPVMGHGTQEGANGLVHD